MELIVSHINSDFDAFSSMVAASLLYPKARLCLVGAAQTNVNQFIKDYGKKFDLIKEKQLNVQKIEKLIIVDNRDISRLGKIGHWLKHIDSEEREKLLIVCYDHHPDSPNDVEADELHVEMTGACTTIMLDFIREKGIAVPQYYASIFAIGIYEDTGNFLNNNVHQKDFEAMSYLFSEGASISFITEYLKNNFTTDELSLMNKMLSSSEIISIKGIEVTFIAISMDEFHKNLAYLLQTIKRSLNSEVIICLARRNDKIQIIARNDYDFLDLNIILKCFGGGGHRSAASALISETDFNILKFQIVNLLEEQILNYGLASEIMTQPVDILNPSTTLDTARTYLLNKHYSTILVGDKDNLIGLITKKDINKALHHKLTASPLEDIMSTNLITCSPDDSLYSIYTKMIDHNIGRIPVISGNKSVLGIITRSDILKSQFASFREVKMEPTNFSSIKNLFEKNTDQSLIDVLKNIGSAADEKGVKAYVVGGFVRDLLLRIPNYDIDIVIEGDGLGFAKFFCQKYHLKYKAFTKFGTAVLAISKNIKIDIVTARSEFYEKPGKLPDIQYSYIRNDTYRRDFTINSLAIQLNKDKYGTLIDFFGGRRDLRLGIIRVLNNLSFVDDPTRILRAVRFEQRFQFKIEMKTFHLMQKSIQNKSIKTIAVERILNELKLACLEKNPDNFFFRLEELELLTQINQHFKFDTKKRVLFQSIYENIIWFRNSFPNEELTLWIPYHIGLIHDHSLRIKEKIGKKFKYPNLFFTCIKEIHNFFDNDCQMLIKSKKKSTFYKVLNNYHNESIVLILAINKEAEIKEKILEHLMKLRFVKMALKGNDLKKLGVEEGVKMGDIMEFVLYQKIDGILKNKNDEIEAVKQYLKKESIH